MTRLLALFTFIVFMSGSFISISTLVVFIFGLSAPLSISILPMSLPKWFISSSKFVMLMLLFELFAFPFASTIPMPMPELSTFLFVFAVPVFMSRLFDFLFASVLPIVVSKLFVFSSIFILVVPKPRL